MYLNCHSYYSLRFGTLSIDDLVQEGKKNGVEAMALTDTNCTTGIFDFIAACRKVHIKPLVGLDFRNDGKQLYVGLAMNQEGLKEMNDFLSLHFADKTEIPKRAPVFENTFVIYPLKAAPIELKENEYVGIKTEERFKILTAAFPYPTHKLVVFHPVTIRNKVEHNLHRLLRAVDYNVVLTKLTPDDYCRQEEIMLPIDSIMEPYKDFPELIKNTNSIIDQCNFDFEFGVFRNKETYTGSKYSDKLLLEQLVKDNFTFRYSKNNRVALDRVKKELDIIHNLGFGGYFLCTWDIIRHSLSRGLFHVGRGSGANSIVAYILKITNVCPIELDLYFERFLNPARKTPPDFDIDWSWQDRDDILSYIFKRFDADCTAFCGTISEFKHRSIHRELGKVMGLPKEEIDQMAANPKDLHDANSVVKQIHRYGEMLKGFPNQLSMHSCGVIISEKPLTYYSPMTMPPKGFRTVQFDMYIAEDIGFEKFDILSQRGLGTIRDSIELIKETKGVEIDFNDTTLYLNNELCNDMLSKGKTLGCFYVESPAMRGLLRRLRANNYLILVAASSVIRPGVAKSGMLREFQRRHNYPNDFEYFHPVFKEHLGETYGVMVYQEDVIKIAHFFGGLDMSDGDILRRGMSGKTRSKKELELVKGRFFENCKKLGHSDELAQEVYRQIESFAGYSFCKSHSASYAVESYLALYLKAYFPLEFMVSVINNFGGFYRSEVYFHEVRMAGGVLEPPCINESELLTRLVGKQIFIGFCHIGGFNNKVAQAIVEERTVQGPFKDLKDFIDRMAIGIEHLQLLIFIGAFRFTSKPKNELVLEARLLFNKEDSKVKVMKLFNEPVRKFSFPKLERNAIEDAFDEIELVEFPVSYTPFQMLRTKYRGNTFVRQLLERENKKVRMLGYLVSRKHVPTARGNMNFGTWVDAEGEFFDSTHFPDCLRRYPFKGPGVYLLEGVVSVEFNFPTVQIEKMDRLPLVADPRYEEDSSKARLPFTKDNHPRPLTRAPYPSKEEVDKAFAKKS